MWLDQFHIFSFARFTNFSVLPNLQERLEVIEKDQHEYTLDEEDRRVQDVILKPEPSKNDAMILKKTLSCSYPNLCFNEALQKENEKLQMELQRSQANYDVQQCEVIQHLLGVTEVAAATSSPEKSSSVKGSKKVECNYSDANSEKGHSYDESSPKKLDSRTTSRLVFFFVLHCQNAIIDLYKILSHVATSPVTFPFFAFYLWPYAL